MKKFDVLVIGSGAGLEVAETIKNSAKFGIKSKIEKIDFASIVKRVSDVMDTDSSGIEKAIKESGNPTLYKMRGKFIGPKRMQVGGVGKTEQELKKD